MWLQATSSEGLGFFRTNKMNHAMNNYSLKISSTSYEVNTPLDSNEENITNHFLSTARSAAPRFCSKLNAEN